MDFLDAVSQLSEKPYVIVGLHFDQVSRIQENLRNIFKILIFLVKHDADCLSKKKEELHVC